MRQEVSQLLVGWLCIVLNMTGWAWSVAFYNYCAKQQCKDPDDDCFSVSHGDWILPTRIICPVMWHVTNEAKQSDLMHFGML